MRIWGPYISTKETIKEFMMNTRLRIFVIFGLILLFVAACDDDKPEEQSISTALNNYWTYQTDLTGSLESREGTMEAIEDKINSMGSTKSRDVISDIDGLVNSYVTKSELAAADFQVLIDAESAIVPYGTDKGILSSLAKGIYNKAKDTVVSSGQMVRSGWRVLSGSQSLRQVLNDPNSGIPIVSNFAERLAKHNADRDASIRTSILENNDQDGSIPLGDLQGTTPQEKLNYYLNLPDDSPLKMNTRRDVMYWDEAERTRTANTARELGETGVKIVGDTYGGPIGEWTNEVVNQHMQEGQTAANTGTLQHTVNSAATANPPITTPKTLVISKANMPDDDPRITVIMNAPQALEQQLPAGSYNIISIADGFIRNVQEGLTVMQGQVSSVMAQLRKLADNAIVIEGLTVQEGSVTLGQTIHAHVACFSSIGKSLSFNWAITGGTYTNLVQNGVDMSFKPTEEKEYTITVTITDSAGNTKSQSITVTSLGGQLVIDHYEIIAEGFQDELLNPGETATVALFIKNTSTVNLTGTQAVATPGGVICNFSSSAAAIAAGQTLQVNVPISIPANYSSENVTFVYMYTTLNQSQIPVQINDQLDVPLDFYVDINQIDSPVTDRVINISGKVSNPLLQTALMILDEDPDQTFDLNLNSGSFSQAVALDGSTEEVQHTVRVYATSGAFVASDNMTFNSLIPVVRLRATLTWDTSGTDVDFWITDPNGEKCYYANDVTASGLTLDFDDTNGYGPENITTTNIIPGDYLVQVHYYSDHNSEIAIPSNCVVVIRKEEGSSQPPFNYYGYVGDTGDVWTVTTLNYEAAKGWTLKAINSHSRVNPNTLPAK